MRPPQSGMPDTGRRHVIRVPGQPFGRLDRSDYSIDPMCARRRVAVRASQTEVTAVVLDTGALVAQHRCVFAGGHTFTDLAHQTRLERQRGPADSAPGRGRDRTVVAL